MRGVSLIELVIVLVVIAIVASLALPAYRVTKERALSSEAIASLKLMAAAERIYRMEIGGYYNSSDVNALNTNLRLLLSEANWDYNITGTLVNYTATAVRNGSGGYLDCQYTLTHDDADGEPNPNGSCP